MSANGSSPVTKMEYAPVHASALTSPAMNYMSGSHIDLQTKLAGADTAAQISKHEIRIQELEAELVENQMGLEARLERAREQGSATARLEAEASAAQLVDSKLVQIDAILQAFAQEREAYFAQVEQEVVKLSLAIAARILKREAHIDPLLLHGVVKVALEQIQEGTECNLHIPVSAESQWREWIEKLTPGLKINVLADAAVDEGECRLETRLGQIELGVKAQLIEVERGFCDLLQLRPSAPKKGRTP